jgi:hypothetical protein
MDNYSILAIGFELRIVFPETCLRSVGEV